MARLALALAALLAATPLAAHAVTVAGIPFPDTLAAAGGTLHLNGAGVRVFFGFVNGYASALYVTTPSHAADTVLGEPNPKILRTEFLHAAGVGQLKREFANVHGHFCAANPCPPANEAAYHQMVDALTPVTKGETATYIVTDTGLQVLSNDKPVMTIANPTYARNFLAAIIGSTSPTPGYRAGLLGKLD